MGTLQESVGEFRFRRIFFPGVVAAAGLHPYVMGWAKGYLAEHYGITSTLLLVVETFIFGLVVSSATSFSLFVIEGFKWRWMTCWMWPFESEKVQRMSQELASLKHKKGKSSADEDRESILTLRLSDYPRTVTSGGPAWVAERPTALGNIIATYEEYPRSRYGIDGISFWYQIIHVAPESAREDFEESLDFAESIILTSVSGIVVSCVGGLTLISLAVGYLFPALALFHSPVPTNVARYSVCLGLAVALVFYWFSLPAYREVSRTFRAMADLAMPEFKKWLASAPRQLPSSAESGAVRRYLDFLHETKEQAGKGGSVDPPKRVEEEKKP